jgi:hypothetical protein
MRLLLVLTLFVSFQLWAKCSEGDKLFSSIEIDAKTLPYSFNSPKQILEEYTANSFKLRDIQSPQFFVFAGVGEDRILSFNLSLKENGERSVYFRGKRVYEMMMKHFDGKFDYISGSWHKGDNLDEFNRNIFNGMSITKAALNTWSGRQAASRGYTKVTIDTYIGDVEDGFEMMSVLFSKE